MATIRTSCSECSEQVDMPPESIRALQFDDGTAVYRFKCPKCGSPAQKIANDKILELLAAAGVPLEHPDDKNPYPEKHGGGPDLTFDDVIDFHTSIAEELEELLGS